MKKSLSAKIEEITGSKTPVLSQFELEDNSVQAELRLRVSWQITYPIDPIHYPKNLGDHNPAWEMMYKIGKQINDSAQIATGRDTLTLHASSKTKTGATQRAEVEANFRQRHGAAFLAAYRQATTKTTLRKIGQAIVALQAQQKALLPEMRRHNSLAISARRQVSAEKTARNAEALASGKFWEADKDALKNYFHPPFARNYLADVSAKWRAALYTEMGSTAWKAGRGGWRHKNIGTGRGYLCGIDDNGDEWGHRVDLSAMVDHDDYGDMGYAGVTVGDAMAVLFGVQKNKLEKCMRQGDLLFCSVRLRKTSIMICSNCRREWKPEQQDCGWGCHGHPIEDKPIELHPHEGPWEIRESHEILSTGLLRNGNYFASQNPIFARHTSHPMITLPPGEYRLYELVIADTD